MEIVPYFGLDEDVPLQTCSTCRFFRIPEYKTCTSALGHCVQMKSFDFISEKDGCFYEPSKWRAK